MTSSPTPGSWTIAEAAAATGLSAHTLRYYERIGLVAPVARRSGIRRYGEADLRWLHFVVRLRATGMAMRDMKRYAQLMRQGATADAIEGRLQLLLGHADRLEADLRQLTDTLAYLRDKIAGYRGLQAAQPSPPLPLPVRAARPTRRKEPA